MTNMEIDNAILELKKWESELNNISDIIENLKTQLKNECISRNEDEIRTDTFVIRYKGVVSHRFDATAFKKDNAGVYAKYLKESISKKFTIN